MKMFKMNLVLLAMIFTSTTYAESIINWQNPEKFKDIEVADGSQKKFQEHVFKQLEKHLVKLSKRLPAGQKLSMTVTDLDLAGKVLPGYAHGVDEIRDLRVIKAIDYPKIKFDYQLINSKGDVIASGTENLKDLAFLDRLQTRKSARDSLGHEKRMLKQWFLEAFPQQVAKK